MKNIYCISGLGADQRIFQKLDIPGAKLVHIPWPPYDKHDEMSCYAQKVAAAIKEENPILLGVSFGGMLSMEIAKLVPTQKIIIVSSAKTKNELPPVSGIVKFFANAGVIPVGLFKNFHKQMQERFGVATDDGKKLLNSIMDDTDSGFVKWAMRAMLHWNNETVPPDVYHIHGTADRMIVPDRIRPNAWIDGGTHFMIYDRAAEISRLITAQLS
ncbi:alpha/beta fold hydrolase [Chitinophagaceae bacterium MMS25-I14]